MPQTDTNNINHQIYIEEVRGLYATQPTALIANLFISILFAAAQQEVIEKNTLLTWLSLVAVVTLLRFFLYRSFIYQANSVEKIKKWGIYFNIGSSTAALLSGLAGILLFPAENAFHQVFCAFVLVGVSAASMPTLSIARYTYPIYITLVLVPLIINYYLQGNQLTLILPVMIFGVYLFLLLSGRRVYLNNTKNSTLRINAVNHEQELLLYQQKQQLHTTNTPLAVIEWSTDFTVKEWNPAAEKIFGYSRKQAIGEHAQNLIIPENSKSKIDKIWHSLLHASGGIDSINENVKANGDIISCEWHNTPLVNKDGEIIGVVSIVNDITQRLNARLELTETKNMLQTVINTIPVRVFWKDKNEKYLGCNALFAGDAGLSSSEDIIGKDDFDMPWKKQANAYQQDDQYVIKNNQSRIGYEERQTQKDGNTIWLETSKVPLKNSNGVIYGVLGTYHDISERKQAESKIIAAKELAEQANKAKDKFMSRMSHELRTPMNAVLGFTQLFIMDKETLSNEQYEYVLEINKAGQHLLEMINQILEISNVSLSQIDLKIESVNLNNLVNSVIHTFQLQAVKNNITFEFSPESNITIKTDRLRLQQVLNNIISNSTKFNNINGKIFIDIETINQRLVTIKIRDTGIGIKAEDQSGIFEPFSRIDDFDNKYDGAGIGLAVVENLLKLLHATIRVESELGQGTVVEIMLPETLSG
ncbi:MAG: PAS domain-containing sensor histidine kinase [Gammaproteobacteria bacterium]|nr:PAS domain-containing sensor histidine kinase [Gammaproteobacteria bacterium]MDH5660174.1 PAS domain-containing sensor histidine kinase [Gammaproteobacteria bacterium]